jgi:hypothetical protein
MYLLNLGHRWNLLGTEGVQGVVLLPSRNSLVKLQRSPRPDSQAVLLDPQLYLASLNAADCTKVCANLASFPWFGIDQMPAFDSGEQTRTQWNQAMREQVIQQWPGQEPKDAGIDEACRAAIETQIQLACTHVILPSPLITEREDEAQRQAEWLDTGLLACADLDVSQPILATVALYDGVINDAAFEAAGFLDTVVDQITAREGIDGVYIVVAQSKFEHPFSTPTRTYRAYAHLAKAFAAAGYDSVITNFADAFGLVCTAFGATAMASGQSQSLRRLSVLDFRDAGGGLAIPYFYSHKIIAELATETDLDNIVAKRLLRRVEDVTTYSQTLMTELAKSGPPKGSARNLPPWAESQNNLTMAYRHLVCRLATEQAKLVKLGSQPRLDAVRDWLESSTANMLFVKDRLKPETLKGCVASSDVWLNVFDELSP